MTSPDEDYENPVGEVLDADTVSDLANEHWVSRLARIVGIGSVRWPFI